MINSKVSKFQITEFKKTFILWTVRSKFNPDIDKKITGSKLWFIIIWEFNLRTWQGVGLGAGEGLHSLTV